MLADNPALRDQITAENVSVANQVRAADQHTQGPETAGYQRPQWEMWQREIHRLQELVPTGGERARILDEAARRVQAALPTPVQEALAAPATAEQQTLVTPGYTPATPALDARI